MNHRTCLMGDDEAVRSSLKHQLFNRNDVFLLETSNMATKDETHLEFCKNFAVFFWCQINLRTDKSSD